LLVIGPILSTHPVLAQKKIQVKYGNEFSIASSILTYNFFTGPDAGDFRTSVKGLGSGLIDPLAIRASANLINIGTDKIYLSIVAGFAAIKYRLAENRVFGTSTEGKLTWNVDPDPTRNYVNSFFGYGKSKLITTSFYFPVDLNMALGNNVTLIAGGYLDINLTARYKMKYLVGEDKVKEIIRSAEFRKFNPSTLKIGLNTTLVFEKLGCGLSAAYCLTPFFKPGMGPDIHETSISLVLDEALWKKVK